MGEAFNYKRYFNKALDQVKALRDPYARKQESVEAGWYSILQHQIVNIGAADFKRPMDSEVPQAIRDTEDGPCIYFNVLGAKNCGRFSEKNVPTRIWAGKLAISHTQSIELDYEKTQLIFDGGKYVGLGIAEAEDFTY